jgi:hypothetical protein
VVWQEGKGPDAVVELLAESTAALDQGEKKQIYQDRLRVPEYVWFDPFSGEWAGFVLREGAYEPSEPDGGDRLNSHRLGLALVRWEGSYQGIEARWLRWVTLEGSLLPTGHERAEREHQQAEEARQRSAELGALLTRYRERFGEIPG